MQQTARSRRIRRLTGLAAVALVAVLAFAVAGGVGGTTPTKRVVKVAKLSDGSSVLANLRGRTLYSLSVEKHGRFICPGGCLSIWHPLVVAKGVRPTGPVNLGTVKRPDGKTQVTYRGRPLYSFANDTKTGEANGEGFKDVGTWHAAKTATSSSQPTEPQPSPYPSPYPTSPQPTETAPQSPPAEEPPYTPPYPY
jgi:predicted lipoprotein with Yx(FWY)xxD motif